MADSQLTGLVVPLEGDSTIAAFLIVIIVTFVFIKRKSTVGTRIDTYLKVVPRLLADILHLRSKGQDAAGTDKHRYTVKCGL